MKQSPEDRAANLARLWRTIHPPLSWILGATLFVYVTLSGAGQQTPEWYALIGGLLGGPFISIWSENKKKKSGD